MKMNHAAKLMGLGSVAALVAVSAMAMADSPKKSTKAAPGAACFAQMKKLAGEWVTKDESGKEMVALKIRVTAAGSAVEETIMPGQPHEMVTIYTMDGDNLVLTHYCALGNQPHMKLTTASTPSKMVFECTGVGNTKSHDEMHMHRGVITVKDDDHIEAVWSAVDHGNPGHEGRFAVTRKKS